LWGSIWREIAITTLLVGKNIFYFWAMPPIQDFDPNSVGLKTNNIFGLPFSEEESALVLLPVPWEVTVSYRTGTADAPAQIFDASLQVDLFDADVKDGWKKGFFMRPVDEDMRERSEFYRGYASQILSALAEGNTVEDNYHAGILDRINDGCRQLHEQVFETTRSLLQHGKRVGLIGGDHSTPFGFIRALATEHEGFGVLQIDAHADLREAYEGFTWSHASIMYNVMQQIPQVTRLVQAGIRDYCDEEVNLIQQSNGRIITFFDQDLKDAMYEGKTWQELAQQIVDALPPKVYISFDIDGLDPKLCPNTGTPVPGGFDVPQIFYLLKLLHRSGRQLIGFDVNEVSPGHTGDIDTIVAARILYKLCNYLVA
jgi:agmatinase